MARTLKTAGDTIRIAKAKLGTNYWRNWLESKGLELKSEPEPLNEHELWQNALNLALIPETAD